jgi:thiol-disulfide isomerase/thioredoxin
MTHHADDSAAATLERTRAAIERIEADLLEASADPARFEQLAGKQDVLRNEAVRLEYAQRREAAEAEAAHCRALEERLASAKAEAAELYAEGQELTEQIDAALYVTGLFRGTAIFGPGEPKRPRSPPLASQPPKSGADSPQVASKASPPPCDRRPLPGPSCGGVRLKASRLHREALNRQRDRPPLVEGESDYSAPPRDQARQCGDMYHLGAEADAKSTNGLDLGHGRRAFAHMNSAVLAIVLSIAMPGTAGEAVRAESAPKGVEILAAEVFAPETLFVGPASIPSTLGNFKGKTVVLNLWATWCGPCVKELPSLDRLAGKLDGNNAVVLAVSQDKGATAIAKPFLDKLGVKNLPPYTDPSRKLSKDFGVRGLPTTFIIACSGMIVGQVEGPLEWDSPEMIRFVTSQGRQRHGCTS